MEELEVPVWYSTGAGMMYNRGCLPPNHPENTYNYIKRVHNIDPELYGVENPLASICSECGHDQEEELGYER